ncbi:hypothetical protein ABSH63_12740 [Sinimarinibacterium sp. HSW-8]|uniref:DUF2946 domain-containing protein n=1 Tax=Sinimarinibacterium thermocellulolyticum TaxID=3170016 RepID=A0ABV2ACF7_9GAMM
MSVCLGILAALMQLLLPQVHATAYAERSGDPLAYALCGAGAAPGLAAELRQILPAEVIAALDAAHASPDLPDCHACVGAHAVAAVQTASASTDVPGSDPCLAATDFFAHQRPIRERPPVRGPPASG